MSFIRQFHDPKLSIWQSAVDEVVALRQAAQRPSSPTGLSATIERPNVTHPVVQEAITYCAAANTGHAPAGSTAGAALAIPLAGTLGYCSMAALRLARAIILKNEQDEDRYRTELRKFGECDPCYAEAAERYAEYFLAQGRKIPYRVYKNIGDFVFEDKLPDRARVAVVGDWGTGQAAAKKVLSQITARKPDVVIHLGDVYYAGTTFEDDTYFYQPWSQILDLPNRKIPTYTLAGNHDMYCGGCPYYQLIDRLGQPASYFCLRNDHWQFLAMDTSLHDSNPVHSGQVATYLEDTELEWHKHQLSTAGRRRTVLLSHHPLFTAYDDIEGHEVNLRFHPQVAPLLENIALWLWGHEHNFVVYGPYLGVERARCIGHGAFPMAIADLPGAPKFSDVPLIKKDDKGKDLALGQTDGFYNHGYAMIDLNGPSATVSYFEDSDEQVPLFQETL
jgi:hypothetical protein